MRPQTTDPKLGAKMYLCCKTQGLLEPRDEADYKIKVEACTNYRFYLLDIIIFSSYRWKHFSEPSQ